MKSCAIASHTLRI